MKLIKRFVFGGPSITDTEPKAPEPEPDLNALLQANTVLYPQLIGPFYTYTNVPWKLRVRKEVRRALS